MPQLTPFYFINEIVYIIFVMVVVLSLLTKLILPNQVRLFIARSYISII